MQEIVRSGTISDMEMQNVTDEYLNNAEPGKGAFAYDAGYQTKTHKEEIKVGEWVHNTLGGDVILLRETNESGVKTPDYSWRGKLWELKTVSTEISSDDAVRRGIKQIRKNPGGIILDYGDNDVSLEKVEEIVKKRVYRGKLTDVDVMILSGGKLAKVLRYKK